jgi:hypothetical protein
MFPSLNKRPPRIPGFCRKLIGIYRNLRDAICLNPQDPQSLADAGDRGDLSGFPDQFQQRDFRRAAPADWGFSTNPAGDVHHRGPALKDPAGVPCAVPTGAHDDAQKGKLDLAAVRVAGQYEIHAGPFAPAKLVRRVAEDDPEFARDRARCVSGWEPGAFVAAQRHGDSVPIGAQPAAAKVGEASIDQGLSPRHR